MKLAKSAIFMMGAIFVSSPVYAQSSVTLFGLIDEGILFNSNAGGSRQYAMTSSSLSGNRWGLRGSEDLGGGLHAIFMLENGFNPNTGGLTQGGDEFGRQAYVGLAGTFGTFMFGRQYDALSDTVAGYSFGNSQHQGGAGQLGGVPGAYPGDINNLQNTNRLNNAIKYVSPLYKGFTFAGEYSLGGVAGDFSRNQAWSAGVTYSGAAFSAGAGFEEINNPNSALYGNNSSSSTTGLNITTPVFSGYASAKTQQMGTVGAAIYIGQATIGAVYSNIRFTDLGATAGTGLNPNHLAGTAMFNIGQVSLSYLITPAWLVGGSYTYTQGSSFHDLPEAKYQQFELASDYLLSKRTDVFTLLLYQRASGYDSTLKPAVAAINSLSPSSSNTQAVVILGIRTRF